MTMSRGAGWPNELDDDEHPSAMRRFIAVHQRDRVSRKLQYLDPPTALRPNGRLWDEAVIHDTAVNDGFSDATAIFGV